MQQVRSTQLKTSPKRSRRQKGSLLAVIFVLPAVLLVAVLMYYPIVQAFVESLYTTSFLSPQPTYIGFEHYQTMFADSGFWRVVRNSLTWTISVVLFQNVIGMATALLLNQNLPVQGLMRTLVLLPWVLPGVVTALLWRFMYDPQLGLINSVGLSLGFISKPAAWLAEPQTAMLAVVIAALEAAHLDGASAWQRFIHVVIPSMSAIIRLNLLLTTIFTFNYFDLIWVTTKGGPLGSTHIFPTQIFELGFGEFRFGEAAAYGVVSVFILSIFAFLYLRELTRARV
jgi:multiple sugar transport system permease protein